jgi:lysophospholipase L1-like esterase
MFSSVRVHRKHVPTSIGVAATTALLLATAACGAQGSSETSSPADSVASSVTAAPTTSTTSSTTTSSSTSTSTTTLPAPPSTAPRPCTLTDVGVEQLLVFGNSTDFTFRPDDGIDLVAWPELLVDRDRTDTTAGVSVVNEAQRGQTMGTWDAWGPDPRLRLNGYSVTVLDGIEPAALDRTLVLLAPSFIDLQESDGDVARAIADLQSILDTIDSYGLDALVLPMNYVSTSIDDRLPELNPDIDAFNEELRTIGLMADPLLDSPLRADDAVGGDPDLYDEFPGRAEDGTFTGPDGFHPDQEGQRRKADAVLDVLASYVERTQPTDGCAS